MPEDSDGFALSEAKRIFAEALEQKPEDRPQYVSKLCGADSDLYKEVVSLLQHHEGAESFFERSPVDAISLPTDPLLGKKVGLYKVLRQIGLGGMGTVYLAERAD